MIGNNPFNIRSSPLASGYRKSSRPHGGHFAIFSSLSRGFEAAAYLLMVGGRGTGRRDQDAYGYRLAINALKNGGNAGAWNFLTAMALSKWDAAHYGVKPGQNAASQRHNHLLGVYLSFGGLEAPPVKPPKKVPIPHGPKRLNPPAASREYLDPYAILGFYRARHGTIALLGDPE